MKTPDAKGLPAAKLYSPSEVMRATGLSRGQFTNRALLLGIPRARLYKVEDVYRIAAYPKLSARNSTAKAKELRDILQTMLEERGAGLRIEETEEGNRIVAVEA